jgi:hypothetical protein
MQQTTPTNRAKTGEPQAASGRVRRAWARPALRALPGLLAALLFGALALRAPAPLSAALALALLAAAAAQPPALRTLRRLAAWPGLGHAAAVAGVIGLGAGLRFWGLGFGLPYLEHPDEWAVADRAVQMLQSGDYNPRSFIYPTLYTSMQLGVALLHFLWGVSAGLYRTLADIELARFYLWGRALTALLGTGALALTYALGRMLYGRRAALAAAALLAVFPAAVADAHYITTDTPAMFFTLLAFLPIAGLAADERRTTTTDHRPPTNDEGSASADEGRKTKDEIGVGVSLFNPQEHSTAPTLDRSNARSLQRSTALALLAGLGVGLAAATKYNAAVLVIPLGYALLLSALKAHPLTPSPPHPLTLSARWLLLALWALLGVLVGFTLGTPLWLRELPQLLNDVASVLVHYKFTGHAGAQSSQPALFYWGALLYHGPLIAPLVLAGALLAFVRRSRADLLVLAFAAPYFLQMCGLKVVFIRNLMPLLPFLCLLAGAALAALAALVERRATSDQRPPTNDEGPATGAQGSTALPLYRSTALPLWLLVALTALAAGPSLLQAGRDSWLSAQPTTRVLATEWVGREAPDGARVWLEDQTLILPARLRVQGGDLASAHDLEWYRRSGFRFLVVNRDVDRPEAQRAQLAAFGAPAADFAAAGLRHGPHLSVYDTGLDDPARAQFTPSGATLGAGALVLEGYRHPPEARPGDTLPLALFWRPQRSLPQDYVLFVHLLGAGGAKAAQRDTPPLDGSLPTSRWRPGALIRDDPDLALPSALPPGTYRLVVGMYDAKTVVPINDQGPIDLGEVVIK